jgi:hypothetical protein
MRLTGSFGALGAALLFLLTGGCSSTHPIARPSNLESFAYATATASGPIDVIVAPHDDDPAASAPHAHEAFRSGSARLLGVAPDGVSVTRRGEEELLKLDEIRGYDVTRHGQGALEGLGIGLLAGVALGAVAGFSAGDDPPCDQNEFLGCLFHMTAGDKAAIGGVVGGLTGALSGVLIGALVGHTDHYVF